MDLFHSLFDRLCHAAFQLFNAGFHPLMRLKSSTQTSGSAIDGSSGQNNSLHITGLGVEWPSKSYGPETFEEWVRQHYDITKPG